MTKKFQKISEIENIELSKVFSEYIKIKQENKGCIVLFQIGEFYEAYLDDAQILSEVCSIYLTTRKIKHGSIIMAGIPSKSIEEYILKLVNNNYRVLICAQKDENGKIKRAIKRIYSKGMLFEDNMLNASKNNYIASVFCENNKTGLAFADISTGEFNVCEGSLNEILNELKLVDPTEVLLPVKTRETDVFKVIDDPKPDIDADFSDYNVTLVKKSSFNNSFVKGKNLGYKCANAILEYSNLTNKEYAPKFGDIRLYSLSDYLMIDDITSSNLELFKSREHTYKGSFLWAIDKTKTSMGKRLLVNFIKKPLKNLEKIKERHLAIDDFKESSNTKNIKNALKNCYDMKRLWGKLTNKTFTVKDFASLKNTIYQGILIQKYIKNFKSDLMKLEYSSLANLQDLFDVLDNAFLDNENENQIFKKGANSSYDRINYEIEACIQKVKEYEEKIKEETNIKNLKIVDNKVFGYYIEVNNKNISKLPEYFKIRQNLSNSSRYTTDELIILNEKINSLVYQKANVEREIINDLKEVLIRYSDCIYELGNKLALIDVMGSFFEISKNPNYSKPNFIQDNLLEFKGMKHPLGSLIVDDFVASDFKVLDDKCFKLLTGPNMAGKSTYMKSIALNIILAQMGSFTCDMMHKSYIFDKIFVHSKAEDYINKGTSTFMAEMSEVKNILENATKKSLVILDELGRGTSTLDGVKLAYSISKYIMEKIGSATIFATHFHKLKVLSEEYPNLVQNLMIGKNFDLDKKVFDRHVCEGFLDESYGINVARAVGLPSEIIENAGKFKV